MTNNDLPTIAPNIKSFQAIAVPTIAGTFVVNVWGIGDDNKMYLWESKTHEWVLS